MRETKPMRITQTFPGYCDQEEYNVVVCFEEHGVEYCANVSFDRRAQIPPGILETITFEPEPNNVQEIPKVDGEPVWSAQNAKVILEAAEACAVGAWTIKQTYREPLGVEKLRSRLKSI